VQRFEDLGDTCSVSVSLLAGRFVRHHEGPGFQGETVASCPARFCFDGDCACPDAAPTDCGGRCVDLDTHPSHCGQCGEACAEGAACVGGQCSCADAAAELCADVVDPTMSVCARTDNDPLHCGDCDTRCGRNVPCVSGHCVPPSFTCGNGVVEEGEDCDDGNTASGDSCPADCLATACGPVAVCLDGDPCTLDLCADAATGTCEFPAAADFAPCDLDGRADTADTCRARTCLPPNPDPALMILEPDVLADPAFSFRTIHDQLAPDGNGAALFEDWASTLLAPLGFNGFTAEARPAFGTWLASLPRDGTGAIDLDHAGFRPAAFINRVDLMGPGH